MLAGCSNSENDNSILPQSVFSSNFTLNYNSMQIKGEMTVDKNAQYTLKINSPTVLKGLKAVVKENDLKINYRGISTSYDLSKLPETAFIPVLTGSLRNIFSSGGLNCNKTDNGYVTSGATDYGNYTLSLSQDCKPQKLEIKEKKFSLIIES